MKTSRNLVVFSLVLGLASAAQALDAVKGPATVEVAFFEPEKFTDVRDGYMGSDKGRDATLATLKEYLVERAVRGLTAGQKLAITVKDIDLAGDFEPWRGPQWSDVRVVKDIYPPRLTLAFRLTGADGAVIKEGTRNLGDLAFMMKMTMGFRDDPLRHEKALIDEWLGAEFRPAKKS